MPTPRATDAMYSLRAKGRRALWIGILGCLLNAGAVEAFDQPVPLVPADRPAPQDPALEQVPRQKLAEFERDFNRGALSALLAQYDPQFIGVLGSDLLDYAQYTGKVREQLAAPGRPPFRIEVHEVRVIDPAHVLANGYTYSGTPGQTVDRSPFTVIYARFGTAWRLIYSHSPD